MKWYLGDPLTNSRMTKWSMDDMSLEWGRVFITSKACTCSAWDTHYQFSMKNSTLKGPGVFNKFPYQPRLISTRSYARLLWISSPSACRAPGPLERARADIGGGDQRAFEGRELPGLVKETHLGNPRCILGIPAIIKT